MGIAMTHVPYQRELNHDRMRDSARESQKRTQSLHSRHVIVQSLLAAPQSSSREIGASFYASSTNWHSPCYFSHRE